MNITINFNCLTSRVKANGLVPIYCTLKKGSEVTLFSTKLSVQKSSWDANKSKVKGKTEEARIINE